MIKVLLIAILFLASIEALSCDRNQESRKRKNNDNLTSELGAYWMKPPAKKRARKDCTQFNQSAGDKSKKSDLQKRFKLAEKSYNRRDFPAAHKIYYELYRKIVKENIEHDFSNSQLVDMFEGLALCSFIVSSKNSARADKLALKSLERALALELDEERRKALFLALELIEVQQSRRTQKK